MIKLIYIGIINILIISILFYICISVYCIYDKRPFQFYIILLVILSVIGVITLSCIYRNSYYPYILSALDVVATTIIIKHLKIQYNEMYKDYLTGAFSRRFLDQYIKTSVHKKKFQISCIMIDIDGFKRVNDEYGHMHGDFLLKQTVTLIQQILQNKKDFVARYGGDEFYIVIHNSDYNMLHQLAIEIENRFTKYNSMVTEEEKISFSIGYDTYNQLIWDNIYQFQHHVDHLMYKNKKEKMKIFQAKSKEN